MEEKKALMNEELEQVSGGAGAASDGWMTVTGLEASSLAMHSKPSFDYSNIMGGCELANGEKVQVKGSAIMGSDGRCYVLVYSPKTQKTGYVNMDFLG